MIESSIALKGEYKFRSLVRRACLPKGKRRGARTHQRLVQRVSTGWVPNHILNNGLDMLGFGTGGLLSNCSVGENNTPPTDIQTALLAYHQHTTNITSSSESNSGSPDYILRATFVYLFATQALNKNYTEVGVGPSAGGTNLFSRALIVDVGGTPTSFSVLAGEQLEVTYRLWYYPQLTDTVSVVNISGTNYTFTTRGSMVAALTSNSVIDIRYGWYWNNSNMGITVYNGAIGAVTAAPGGSSYGSGTTNSLAGYTAGNYYRDCTYAFSTTQGNLGGGITAFVANIRTSNLFSPYSLQTGVSPAIAKDNTKTFSITVRHSWARVP